MEKTKQIIRFNQFIPVFRSMIFSITSLLLWNILFLFLNFLIWGTNGSNSDLFLVIIGSIVLFILISLPASLFYLLTLFTNIKKTKKSEIVRENLFVWFLSQAIIFVLYLFSSSLLNYFLNK